MTMSWNEEENGELRWNQWAKPRHLDIRRDD